MDKILRFILFLFCCTLCLFTKTVWGQSLKKSHVQLLLKELAPDYPEKVLYLLETRKWYLKTPRPGTLSIEDELRLQDAFYADCEGLFRSFGIKYLADWKALLAKSARESFWGSSFLSIKANNYFGIRSQGKDWICQKFGFCESVTRNDPEPAAFVSFPDFESCLWMFIHTIYSPHFLERLPDKGKQIADAIQFERQFGIHYWQVPKPGMNAFSGQIPGKPYDAAHIFATWSGFEINNLCVDCDAVTDNNWLKYATETDLRARQKKEKGLR